MTEEKNLPTEEAVYQAHCVWTEKRCIEVQKFTSRKGRILATLIVVALMLFMAIWYIYLGIWKVALVYFVSGIVIIGFYFYLPYRSGKRQYRRRQLIHGEDASCELIFSQNGITISTATDHETVECPYEGFTKLVETKKAYFMYLRKKAVLPVYKDEFVKGDAETFAAFITEKCRFGEPSPRGETAPVKVTPADAAPIEEGDILFEARGVWTAKRCVGFQGLALRTSRIVGLILCLCALVPIVRLVVLGAYVESTVCAVLYLSVFTLLLLKPHRLGKRMYQYHQAVYGCASAFRYVFMENGVTDFNLVSGGEEKIPYEKVQRICKRKAWYFLLVGEKLYLAFRTDELTKGDAAAFEAFIREKCPNAKRNFK